MMQRVADLAVQLAVGKRAGAALAELHVRLGMQLALAPQVPGVLRAFAHFLAAVEDDRAESHLRQDQPGEQPARAEADHQRPVSAARRGLGHEVVAGVRRGLHVGIVGEALQQFGFARGVDVQRIDQHDRAALAGVVAAPGDAVAGECGGFDVQPLEDRGGERGLAVIERQLEVGQSQHGGPGRSFGVEGRWPGQLLSTRCCVPDKARVSPPDRLSPPAARQLWRVRHSRG